MKAFRFLRALPFALVIIASPLRAGQGTIVGPVTGPKTMTEVMGVINSALLAIQSCNSGNSAPANGVGGLPTTFQCWADTSAAPVISYKFYDGASWVTFGELNSSSHIWTPYRNGAPIATVATSSSASDLTSGTLPAARLPLPSASTLGGVQSLTCSSSNWFRTLSTSGIFGCSQPSFSDISGSVASAQMPAFSGDVTTSAGSTVTAIGANKVTDTMLRQSAALSLLGRSANSSGNVADISASAGSSCAFRESGNTVGCGTLATAALANNAVTNAKLAQMANATTKCRTTAGTGDPEDCTASQMRSLLSLVPSTNVQVWDADLDCIAAISSTGLMVRTGAGTCATRQVVAPAAGITVTNPAGLAGDITLALANDLAAIEALASTGFAVRTGPDAWNQRSITGTSNEVCVTNGDGVSGNPTLGICSGWLSTAHTWAGTQTFAAPVTTGALDVQGTIKVSSFVTSTQITANQNNYTATDGSNTCSSKTTLRISTDASRNITGLSCGQAEGDVRIVHNVGAQTAVLTNQDTNSTAANRFLFGGDISLGPDTSVTIRYDGVASRWRAITSPGAGGGGGGVTSVTVAAGEGVATSGTCTITTSGTCTVARADAVRQNFLLDLAYQAKLFGDPRRVIGIFADGYKSSNGINAGSSSNYTVNTATGYLGPGPNLTTTTITTATGTSSGSATTVSRAAALTNGVTITSIGIYSTVATSFTMKIVKENSTSNYDILVSQGVSHPGTGWVDFTLSSSYTVPGSGTYYPAVYTGAGSYSVTSSQSRSIIAGDQGVQTGLAGWTPGTGDVVPVRYTYGSGVLNMTAVSTAQTTDSSVSTGRVLIEYDNTAAPTLNTDVTAEVTCNGGTNWASGTLAAVTSYSQAGRKVAETAAVACTSGSSAAMRLKTFNNKDVRFYGATLNVNWLLHRDLDPASNDNSPMWLTPVA